MTQPDTNALTASLLAAAHDRDAAQLDRLVQEAGFSDWDAFTAAYAPRATQVIAGVAVAEGRGHVAASLHAPDGTFPRGTDAFGLTLRVNSRTHYAVTFGPDGAARALNGQPL